MSRKTPSIGRFGASFYPQLRLNVTQDQERHLHAVSTESTGDMLLGGALGTAGPEEPLKAYPGPASGLARQVDLGVHATLTLRLCWPWAYPSQ